MFELSQILMSCVETTLNCMFNAFSSHWMAFLYIKRKKKTFNIKKEICGGVPMISWQKVLDCCLEVNKFEPQLHYYIHFEKDMKPLSPSSYGLNSITAALQQG